jgi:hypothetical protein
MIGSEVGLIMIQCPKVFYNRLKANVAPYLHALPHRRSAFRVLRKTFCIQKIVGVVANYISITLHSTQTMYLINRRCGYLA